MNETPVHADAPNAQAGAVPLAQFRDLSFQATEASMQRLMRLDALLAAGQVAGAPDLCAELARRVK